MKNCSSSRNGHCNGMMKPLRVGKDLHHPGHGTPQGGKVEVVKTLLENRPVGHVGRRRQDHAVLHGRAPDRQDKGSSVSEIFTVALAFSQYRTANVKGNFIDSLKSNPEFCLSFTLFILTCSRWRRNIAWSLKNFDSGEYFAVNLTTPPGHR